MNGASLGYLLAFFGMFVSAISNFPFTDAARRWGSVALNHFRLVVALVVLTLLCVTIGKLSFTDLFTGPSMGQYLYVGASGVLGLVVGDYFGFYAMAILGARVSSIFNTIAPIATLAFGFLLLNENISFIGIVGILLSIVGVIWFLMGGQASEDSPPVLKHGTVRKGIIFGVLAGLCQGFHLVVSKKGFNDTSYALSPLHATWIRILAATVVYYVFTISRGRLKQDVIVIIREGKDIMGKVIFATMWGLILSIVLVMWSVTLCKAAVVQTIISLIPIVVVPMSFVLYKEKLTFRTMLAALVSVSGVFILIWREDISQWLQLHLH